MELSTQDYTAETELSPAESVIALAAAEGIPEPGAPTKPKVDIYRHNEGCFEVSDAGVFWRKGDGAKKRICDELRIRAEARDQRGCNWSLVLEWRDKDGNWHHEHMPTATLHGESSEAAKTLASGGLRLSRGKLPTSGIIC